MMMMDASLAEHQHQRDNPPHTSSSGGGSVGPDSQQEEKAGEQKISLSFSFSKPLANAKRKIHDEKVEQQKDFVLSIAGGHLESTMPEDAPLVIPLPKPAPRPTKMLKTEEAKGIKMDGLSAEDREAAEALIKEGKESLLMVADEDAPMLVKNRLPGLAEIEDEDERFRFDVAARPDETDSTAYEKVPIEKFGEAMLRGMNWNPGDPIGLTNKAVVKPIEYVSRHHRLGLGATPKPIEPVKKKYIKPGESREPKPMMMVPKDADGRQRHVRNLDEKLVPFRPEGIHPGNRVSIISGEHQGMHARVVSLLPDDKVLIKFQSEEEVTVNRDNLATFSGKGQDQHLSREPSRSTPSSSDSAANREREKKEKQSKRDKHKKDQTSKRKKDKTPMWIHPNIVVRIISKRLGEKYYRKKVRILDVVTADRCTIILDSGRVLEDIHQRHLETVIPEVGGRVLIVLGKHRGRTARLLQKSSSEDRATVQMDGDVDIETCTLDQIAQYSEAQ